MSMFGPRPGSWYLTSKKDPRWDAQGRGACGMGMPLECEQTLKHLKQMYGTPPDDLEWGYMKD